MLLTSVMKAELVLFHHKYNHNKTVFVLVNLCVCHRDSAQGLAKRSKNIKIYCVVVVVVVAEERKVPPKVSTDDIF